MNEWKKRNDCMEIYFFCDLLSPNVFGTPRGGGKCHLFSAKYILSTEAQREKKPESRRTESEARPLCQQNLGESVQMYLVLKKSCLVFMETSVVLFRRSFLFRSTNRNWSAQRGISPEKWPSTNLFPLEICLCRTRCLSLQWFPMENK